MQDSPFHIAAYFPEWEVRRPFTIRDLERNGTADKITIINYAFGAPGPDPDTGEVVCQFRDADAAYRQVYTAEMSVDGAPDAPNQPLRGHFNQIRKLKARHPHLKVVVSLGGWTDSGWFSDAARTPATREKFVASCIDTYIHGHLPEADGAGGEGAGVGVFDGIDIDWEYPIAHGLDTNHYHPADDENFVLLLEEFRRQYAAIGRPDLLLTAAVPGPGQARQYQMQKAHPLLDLVAVMTYDLRGVWDAVTGHHTSLYASDLDPAPAQQRLSADGTLRLYRDELGVPAHKLLIGAAFYGKAWKEVGSAQHGLFQPGQFAFLSGNNYRDLLAKMRQGYERHFDASACAPWLYNEQEGIFYTYDDPESVALKSRYIKHNGMGGVMFWEISGDDDQGTLVSTIYENLKA